MVLLFNFKYVILYVLDPSQTIFSLLTIKQHSIKYILKTKLPIILLL